MSGVAVGVYLLVDLRKQTLLVTPNPNMVFKALIIYRVQLIFEPVLSVDNLAGFLIESALHIILDPVYPHPVLSLVDAVASHSERSLGLFESVFQLSSGKQITKLKTSQLCDYVRISPIPCPHHHIGLIFVPVQLSAEL